MSSLRMAHLNRVKAEMGIKGRNTARINQHPNDSSNPRGNTLSRVSGFNTKTINEIRPRHRRKKLLRHQLVERTPWNKDPYKVAQSRAPISIHLDTRLQTGKRDLLASNIGAPESNVPQIQKHHQIINGGPVRMRGHTDSRRHETKQNIARDNASRNRLILDRALN